MKMKVQHPDPVITPAQLASAMCLHASAPTYNGDSRCWTPTAAKQSPPTAKQPPPLCVASRLLPTVDSALDLIGNTPMVRLSRFAAEHGIKCELLGKCEFFNPGGSVKDRIGKEMLRLSKQQGQLKTGDTIIEASSGNAGIGLALAAVLTGHKISVTMPDKMSMEKEIIMQLLGAQLIRTPNVTWDHRNSHLCVAQRIALSRDDVFRPDQYTHDGNCLAHYWYTGPEILAQCHNQLDMLVIAAGTGGTITGVSSRVKETVPNCKVVGVDPQGSLLAAPAALNAENIGKPYQVEGIGYDFVPDVLNRRCVDQWVKTDDMTSFRLARDLVRLEGLMCGGSSGAALQAALVAAQHLEAHQRCVVVLPDGLRNYMTTFASDGWMMANGYMAVPPPCASEYPVDRGSVGDLPLTPISTAFPKTVSLRDLIDYFTGSASQEVAVITTDGYVPDSPSCAVVGYVTKCRVLRGLSSHTPTPLSPSTSAEDSGVIVALSKSAFVTKDVSIYEVLLRLQQDTSEFLFVSQHHVDQVAPNEVLCEGIVSRSTLMKFILSNCPT